MSDTTWKLVPVEPTPEMFEAARRYWFSLHKDAAAWPCGEAMGIYAAMLAAAPTAPTSDAAAIAERPVASEGVQHFNFLCSLLPEGFHWSDPLTPDVLNHIVSALAPATPKTDAIAPTDGAVDAIGEIEIGSDGNWNFKPNMKNVMALKRPLFGGSVKFGVFATPSPKPAVDALTTGAVAVVEVGGMDATSFELRMTAHGVDRLPNGEHALYAHPASEPQLEALTTGAVEQSFPYQKTFNAIAAATRIESGHIAISVSEFCKSFAAHPASEPQSEDGDLVGDACPRCGGSGFVPDGEITGSGGIEYENGPVQCVKDCPVCTAHSASGPKALTLLDSIIRDMEGGFVKCENCGEQEAVATLDFMPMLRELRTLLADRGSEGK
jgi:hypothetical protein